MDALLEALPAQFLRRAETARFIVDLEMHFGYAMGDTLATSFPELPPAPDHLDRSAVEECRAIAGMLALARRNQCESELMCRGRVTLTLRR